MTRKSKAAWILAVAFTGAAAQSAAHEEHWSAPAAAAKRKNPVSASLASIEQGKQLFAQNCASCHGPAGRGDGPAAAALKPQPANLAIMAGHHSDGDLAWKIANGRGAMPPWKGMLSENQIWILVNYIKSLPRTDGQPRHKESHHH
jgi:mono/diheme cytochrome c family protein